MVKRRGVVMEKMLIATIIVAALLGNACLQAEAMEKVSPAAGVITMATTQTGEESLSHTGYIPVYAGPTRASGKVDEVSSPIAVVSPLHEVAGFIEMVLPNRRHAWISADKVKPCVVLSDPKKACARPWLMSNGYLGWGP